MQGGVSPRVAFKLAGAVVEALPIPIESAVISRTTIQRRVVSDGQEAMAASLQTKFPSICILHHDSKRLRAGHVFKENFAIGITGPDRFEKLLNIKELPDGTSRSFIEAIRTEVERYQLVSHIKFVCSDTPNVNFGHIDGLMALYFKEVSSNVLFIQCRHHVLELILAKVWGILFAVSNGPNLDLCEKFSKVFDSIKANGHETGLELANFSNNFVREHLALINQIAEGEMPRKDYKLFLDLISVFLGNQTVQLDSINLPSTSKVRWMNKAIYCLAILLFRRHFQITPNEHSNLVRLAKFIIEVYFKYWFTCKNPITAAYNDFALINQIVSFPDVQIATAAFRSFSNHLHYLNPELVCLSLYDSRLSVEVKNSIRSKLIAQFVEFEEELIDLDAKELIQIRLAYQKPKVKFERVANLLLIDLFNKYSLLFFKVLDFDYSFLTEDATIWDQISLYNEQRSLLLSLNFVNDYAERLVSTIKKFDQHQLTKNADAKENNYQLNEINQRLFKNVTKKSFA